MSFKTADLCDEHADRIQICDPEFTSFGGRVRFHGPVSTIRCFEDNSRVREAVGPMVASSSNIFALSCHKDPSVMPGELRDELMKFVGVYREPDAPIETRHLKLYEGYLQHLKDEHEALMTKKVIQATTLTGTKQEVIGMIEAMRDAGVHQVAIQPIRPSREVVDQVAREIMPAFA